MKLSGMRCPKCGRGKLERWVEGDEMTDDATWIAYRCDTCDYVLKIKHTD